MALSRRMEKGEGVKRGHGKEMEGNRNVVELEDSK